MGQLNLYRRKINARLRAAQAARKLGWPEERRRHLLKALELRRELQAQRRRSA